MKRSSMIVAAGLSVLIAFTACNDNTGPADEVFTATLTGAAERPDPVTTSATGTARVTVNLNRTLTVSVTATGMTPTVQHIHGPADVNTAAGIIVGIPAIALNQTIAASALTGAVSYDSLLVLLRAGRTYVNVHSAAFPGGEIRGQLTAQ